MALVQDNAWLTKVEGPATGGEDWEDPEVAGGVLWQGSVRVYFRQVEDRLRSAQTADVVVRRTLVVDAHDPPVEWAPQQVVQVDPQVGATFSSRVQAVERVSPPPGFRTVATVRLVLENA